jgi:hypothetical protein
VGGAFEDVGGLLRRDEPADIVDARLVLYQNQSVEVLGKRHQSWILQEVWVFGRELGDLEVIPGMRFHEVVLGSDHDGVALVVVGEAGVDAGEVLPDLDGRVGRLVAVERAVGGEDEEQVAVVAGEVLVAEVIGEVVGEVGPHCHVHVPLERDEEVVEQLGLALPHAH